MFWGLVVQPNKKYSKTVSTPFHVSQAVLDITTTTPDTDVQLILKSDKVDYILCILRKSETVQVPLDLIFSEGDEISFRSVGGTVHLTGYLVDDQDFGNIGDVESSDAEEEVPTLVPASKTSKKIAKPTVQQDDSSSDEELVSEGDDTSGEDVEEESEESGNDSEPEVEEEPPQKKSKIPNGQINGVSKKDDKKQKKPQLQATTEKNLQGGVKIEDVRLGKGAEAKPGKKVQVYYEGRFQKNNKVFDKTNTGEGLKFVLGRGEVIKGWDIGVAGMKVGSKRRITCPPNMAYGSKGSPPVIPPNSTLVFEVELRGVN